MGAFGLNLLMTVEIQVGILQNFVLTTVVTEETATTAAIAQRTFLQQSFSHGRLPTNMCHIPMGRSRLGLGLCSPK